MFGEEIVQEIDKTLDQLIQNAEVISGVDLKELSESEMDAFQKTQESLLQRLMHMDQMLGSKLKASQKPPSANLQQKRMKFERLKTNYSKGIAERIKTRPIVCKRKAKRFFDLRSRKKSILVNC